MTKTTTSACNLLFIVALCVFCFPRADSFQSKEIFRSTLLKYKSHMRATATTATNNPRSVLILYASSRNNYEYKDDCFGFMSFLGGIAAGDPVFAGVFVTLSLTAAFATQKGWLPADPKRNTIVDRKVPGIVAALTLLISSSPVVADLLITAANADLDIPPVDPTLKSVQLGICTFSVVTAFLDIRWRDRFDYPEEFRD